MDSHIDALILRATIGNLAAYLQDTGAHVLPLSSAAAQCKGTVCGRIKSDFRYSVNIVYNNFPWLTPTDGQKAKIKQTAQAILDARALYPNNSFANLYDETAIPPELRRAHQQNDRAVMQAYGFSVKDMTESRCVAELMRMYQALTNQ